MTQLTEITAIDGEIVYINPDQIASLRPLGSGTFNLTMSNREGCDLSLRDSNNQAFIAQAIGQDKLDKIIKEDEQTNG